MQHIKAQLQIVGIFVFLVSVVISQDRTVPNATEGEFPTRPGFEFGNLKLSEVLRAKAMLKWMINNRTENGTKTFNAGFIRLIFHDCVGGCDGCVNLRNPSNSGLGFYKLPLDLMYRDFVFPMMSRADWYTLAGITAVEYAAELTLCKGRRCKQAVPELNFLYGRKDCVTESALFRSIPGPARDPRFTIRNTFRLNFVEITALMGAHCLGKNHQRDTRWVDDGTRFDNQYYKDMLADHREWKRGNGTAVSEWTSKSTGNVMLSSDMFMAFDVSNPQRCDESPMKSCNKTNTFELVRLFAEDNEFWMREFSVAFNVMLMNGNFGRLKIPILDTLDKEWKGDPDKLFGERNTDTDYEFDREAFGLPPLPVANATSNAADSATNAAGNADNAAGNADNAAGNADSSAGNADNSAGNADSSAGNADNSAGNADNGAAETANTESQAANTEAETANTASETDNTDSETTNTETGTTESETEHGIVLNPSPRKRNTNISFRRQVIAMGES